LDLCAEKNGGKKGVAARGGCVCPWWHGRQARARGGCLKTFHLDLHFAPKHENLPLGSLETSPCFRFGSLDL